MLLWHAFNKLIHISEAKTITSIDMRQIEKIYILLDTQVCFHLFKHHISALR